VAAATAVVGSPWIGRRWPAGRESPLPHATEDGSPEEWWASTACRCWTGTGTRCLARLRLKDHGVGAKRPPPPLDGLGHRIPRVRRRPTWHNRNAARHRLSTPTVPACAQPSGCRSSTSLPTRRWSRVWPPRPRRPAGTGSSSGTTCAGGRRSGRWPTPGSRWRRSPLPPNGCGSAPWSRPWPAAGRPRVARETATLDRLSGGRLTLGVGLGSDRFGSELSKTAEQLDDRLRGQMLDEALEILTAAWSGEPVQHRGRHYTVEGIQFLPRPAQNLGCRCGPRDSPATSNRCAGPPVAPARSVVLLPHLLRRTEPSVESSSCRPRRGGPGWIIRRRRSFPGAERWGPQPNGSGRRRLAPGVP
jgi:hypothetical protein